MFHLETDFIQSENNNDAKAGRTHSFPLAARHQIQNNKMVDRHCRLNTADCSPLVPSPRASRPGVWRLAPINRGRGLRFAAAHGVLCRVQGARFCRWWRHKITYRPGGWCDVMRTRVRNRARLPSGSPGVWTTTGNHCVGYRIIYHSRPVCSTRFSLYSRRGKYIFLLVFLYHFVSFGI